MCCMYMCLCVLPQVKNIAAYLMGIMKRMQPGGNKGGAGGKARRFA